MKTMTRHLLSTTLLALPLAMAADLATAAPVGYDIDPEHTYPSIEAGHMGISVWRGKFNTTIGKVVLDKTAGTGTVEVTIDIRSIDFGHEKLNAHVLQPDIFDAAKYPSATYRGKFEGFDQGAPTRLVGTLTLHGVTRPVELKINSFKCIPHPMLKREVCGADALATIQRDEFGIDAGKDYGFSMDVTLRIQVEAIQEAPGG